MIRMSPYLNFGGNAEEAFAFYKSVFGGDYLAVMRYRDFGQNPMGLSEQELDRIAHIALPVGDKLLMASDAIEWWQPFRMGNNYYITLETDSVAEADRLFDALSSGGKTEMEMQRTEWAEKYGTCAGRFGVQWMVMYTRDVQFAGGLGEAFGARRRLERADAVEERKLGHGDKSLVWLGSLLLKIP